MGPLPRRRKSVLVPKRTLSCIQELLARQNRARMLPGLYSRIPYEYKVEPYFLHPCVVIDRQKRLRLTVFTNNSIHAVNSCGLMKQLKCLEMWRPSHTSKPLPLSLVAPDGCVPSERRACGFCSQYLKSKFISATKLHLLPHIERDLPKTEVMSCPSAAICLNSLPGRPRRMYATTIAVLVKVVLTKLVVNDCPTSASALLPVY